MSHAQPDQTQQLLSGWRPDIDFGPSLQSLCVPIEQTLVQAPKLCRLHPALHPCAIFLPLAEGLLSSASPLVEKLYIAEPAIQKGPFRDTRRHPSTPKATRSCVQLLLTASYPVLS